MVGYKCRYCPTEAKDLFANTIGPHYIKHHSEYLIENFKPFGRMSNPIAPYKGRHGFYLCLCCKQYHSSEASAKTHLEKCSADQQLEAIYTLIGERPTNTTVTVKAEATKSDVGLIKRIHMESSKVDALENEITHMKKQLQRERLKFKAYREWAEKDRCIAVSLEKERYDTLRSRLVQDNGNGWAAHIQFTENLEVDEDDVHKLAASRMSYDCYNKGAMPATPAVLEVVPPPPAPITSILHCEGCCREADQIDLGHCSQCKHRFHTDDGVTGCYLFECDECGKPLCDNCRKTNKTPKNHPKCDKCTGPKLKSPQTFITAINGCRKG
jgi:hypothetical protein